MANSKAIFDTFILYKSDQNFYLNVILLHFLFFGFTQHLDTSPICMCPYPAPTQSPFFHIGLYQHASTLPLLPSLLSSTLRPSPTGLKVLFITRAADMALKNPPLYPPPLSFFTRQTAPTLAHTDNYHALSQARDRGCTFSSQGERAREKPWPVLPACHCSY